MSRHRYDDRLEEIKRLADQGASYYKLSRELKLAQDLSLRRYLREEYPELHAKVTANGKANQLNSRKIK